MKYVDQKQNIIYNLIISIHFAYEYLGIAIFKIEKEVGLL